MGLGLRAVAKLPKSEAGISPLELISATAKEFAVAKQLSDFHRAERRNGVLYLSFHPADEDVEVEVLESGKLVVSSKTSGAGPGYHQLIVELTDQIARDLGIDWGWSEDASDDTSFDEMGYARERDFASLQDEMAAMFRGLAEVVVERLEQGYTNQLVNMPLNYGVQQLGDEIGTPIGPFSRKFYEQAANDTANLTNAAREFFPWWESGLTAATWRNLGLVSLWMDIYWRPPQSDDERTTIRRTLACFEHAMQLDRDLPTPDTEIAELRRLLEVEYSEAPKAHGIGYRRRDWRQELTGGWTLRAPGFFYERSENDGTTAVYWYGDREIWGSSWTLKPARKATIDDVKDKIRPESFMLDHDGIVGCANVRTKETDEGRYFVVSCALQGFGSSAVVTIVVPDEAEIPWARQVFESVRLRLPRGSQKEG